MFGKKKEELVAQAGQALLQQLPVDVGRLQKAAKYLEPKRAKWIAVAVVGGSAALSLIGKLGHDRIYQAAVSRELKKQLAPIQKQLDELAAQNEDLIRQNEMLREDLAKT